MPKTGVALEDLAKILEPKLKSRGALKAIVFGSYARGDAREDSDLDLIVITKTDRQWHDRLRDYWGLKNGMPVPLDFRVYTPEEVATAQAAGHRFLCTALAEGKAIYGEDLPYGDPSMNAPLDFEAEARVWLREAEHNFRMAKVLIENEGYNDACFYSHQVVEKTFKALTMYRPEGRRGHKLGAADAMLDAVVHHFPDFEGFRADVAMLDPYYIQARYVDANSGAAPLEIFSRAQADDAIERAGRILTAAQQVFTAENGQTHGSARAPTT